MTSPLVPVDAKTPDWPRKVATAINRLIGQVSTALARNVPAGGTTGQVLEKVDATDYNTQWASPGPSVAILTFHADAGANYTATNQAVAEQNLNNSARNEVFFDATGFTQVRLATAVVTLSASVNNPRLYPQYWNGSAWTTVGTGLTTQCISLASTGTKVTDWLTIPSGALADVRWRVAMIGGDAAADPAMGNITLQFR